jgi:hypothetical protein
MIRAMLVAVLLATPVVPLHSQRADGRYVP